VGVRHLPGEKKRVQGPPLLVKLQRQDHRSAVDGTQGTRSQRGESGFLGFGGGGARKDKGVGTPGQGVLKRQKYHSQPKSEGNVSSRQGGVIKSGGTRNQKKGTKQPGGGGV